MTSSSHHFAMSASGALCAYASDSTGQVRRHRRYVTGVWFLRRDACIHRGWCTLEHISHCALMRIF